MQLVQDISDGDWPTYPLADQLPDLIGLTFDIVELLDVPSHSWLHIRKGHAVQLNVNLHIFLRRCGVVCLDFDLHYSLFVHSPRPPNIRTNMHGERDFLALPSHGLSKLEPVLDMVAISRESGPKRNLVEEDSSSEVEIIEDYIPQPRHLKSGSTAHRSHSGQLLLGKCKIKDEPSTSPPPVKHPRSLVSQLGMKGASTNPINIEFLSVSPTPSASSTVACIPPNSPSPSWSAGEPQNLSAD